MRISDWSSDVCSSDLLAIASLGDGLPATTRLVATLLALALASAGLLASFWHLGKPLRAWRAFSQWRTSWLSREGVAAVLTYVPALLFAAALLPAMIGSRPPGEPVAPNAVGSLSALALMDSALETVGCTELLSA